MSVTCLPRALMMGAFFLGAVVPVSADISKAETTPVIPSATSGPEFRSAVERRTFELVNAYRQQAGFDPLTWNEGIARIARAHSKDMATGEVDFGHGGFSDRVIQVKQAFPGFRGMGENVLYTEDLTEVANTAVTMWLRSPHHRANIRGDYNDSGIGVWQKDDGTIYFTQIFVKVEALPKPSPPPTNQPPPPPPTTTIHSVQRGLVWPSGG